LKKTQQSLFDKKENNNKKTRPGFLAKKILDYGNFKCFLHDLALNL